MKICIYLAVITIFVGLTCSIYAQRTFIQQDLGSDTNQGLKHIYDKAVAFIEIDNSKNQIKWKALEPNAKTIISRCLVPLTAKWGVVFVNGAKPNISIERYSIFIACQKDIMNTSWTVLVPTTRPDHIVIHKE